MEVQPIPDANKFTIGEAIVLSVTARTNVEIKVNFGATRIFMFDEKLNNWHEVKDQVSSRTGVFSGVNLLSRTPDVILSQNYVKNHSQKTQIFGVIPDVQNNGKSVDVLVIVSGNILVNGIPTKQKTGTYVIFTLRP